MPLSCSPLSVGFHGFSGQLLGVRMLSCSRYPVAGSGEIHVPFSEGSGCSLQCSAPRYGR